MTAAIGRKLSLIIALFCLQAGFGQATAAVVTITFDEAGIGLDDTITTQYAAAGATFSGTGAVVKTGSSFNNPFPSDGQIVHFDARPVLAFVHLDTGADFLSIDFRRPSDAGDIFLRLFQGANLVLDAGRIGWDPAVTPDWDTFEYLGGAGLYDRIELSSSNKFVIDNLSFQPVPLPLPVVLLLSALGGLWASRRTGIRLRG